MQACAACHGRVADSVQDEVYYPSLEGKPVEYLYQQLLNFREGRRVNPIMEQMLAYLSPEYLHEIASSYAGQTPLRAGKPVARPGLDPPRAARARQLVQTGDELLVGFEVDVYPLDSVL